MWAGVFLTCLCWVLAASASSKRGMNLAMKYSISAQPKRTPLFCPDNCGMSNVNVSRIVGGEKASRKEYPWMARLEQGCGGALIKAQWVLTAAHCFDGLDPMQFNVILGRTNLAKDIEKSLVLKPKRVIIHEDYNILNAENDIALIELPNPVTFKRRIMPICVAEQDSHIPFGSTAVATGWGDRREGAFNAPDMLREVVLDVIDDARCKELGDADPELFICALTKGKDTCQGDSGGPLIAKLDSWGRWAVVGIVSHGVGCARENEPGVYTRVPHYATWITQKTGGDGCN